jgi:PBP1b-binding outer membrane lipoprotein LpoB
MRIALIVCIASLAMLLAGCGSTIRPEGAAKSVVDLVKEQTGFEAKDVKCPDGVEAKEGTTFECKFTGPEGEEYTANMRVTKVEGDDVEFYIETKPSGARTG